MLSRRRLDVDRKGVDGSCHHGVELVRKLVARIQAVLPCWAHLIDHLGKVLRVAVQAAEIVPVVVLIAHEQMLNASNGIQLVVHKQSPEIDRAARHSDKDRSETLYIDQDRYLSM
jgi:hypothetical protein